jgi:bla regulator protein blaR1
MKQSNKEVGDVLKDKLEQQSPSVSFENVWGKHVKTKGHIFGFRKVFAVPMIALFVMIAIVTVGFASIQITRMIDKTDYPFIPDTEIIGKWQTVDFVTDISEFNPEQKVWKGDLYLSNFAFINEGKMLISFNSGNGNLAYTDTTWTKGLIISNQEKTASQYEIKDIDGSLYMFSEWKSGDYIFDGMKPKYYVLKKVDSEDYSKYETVQIEDKIDYPFIDDEKIIGNWDAVDFVRELDDFSPGTKSWRGNLFVTHFEILNNGELSISCTNGKLSHNTSWTKGLIIDADMKTASKYEIKEFDGETFMFYEWKSGDYTLRGMKPCYYVLKKVK